MESQNYLTIAIEKMGHVMLDDRHMKASDIYKTAVKLHKKRIIIRLLIMKISLRSDRCLRRTDCAFM